MKSIQDIFNFIYFPIIIIVSSMIIYYLIKIIFQKFLKFNLKKVDRNNRRQNTLIKLFKNIIKIIIIIIVLLIILNFYGINIDAILASLGVVSVVLGLSFQDILKDLLAGVFILIEGNITIDDTISIGGFKGTVKEIGLKNTKIKSETGEIKIMANRNIGEVINYSIGNSVAIIDILFDINTSDKEINEELNLLITKIKNIEEINGEIKIIGISSINLSSVTYRISVVTKPSKEEVVQKLILMEYKKMTEKRLKHESI